MLLNLHGGSDSQTEVHYTGTAGRLASVAARTTSDRMTGALFSLQVLPAHTIPSTTDDRGIIHDG